MKKELKFYEQKNCCKNTTNGLFGKLAEKEDKVIVERFNISENLQKFVTNPIVLAQILALGNEALPLTVLNGELIKIVSYPTFDELVDHCNPSEEPQKMCTCQIELMEQKQEKTQCACKLNNFKE